MDLQARKSNSEEDKQGVKAKIDIAPNNFILDFIIEMYNLAADAHFKKALLQVIGKDKIAIADSIITLVGNSNKKDTIDLAKLVTPTNAAYLKDLIDAVGVNNISKIKQSGIVPVMGLAHIGLLPKMIENMGGFTNLETLKKVIAYRHTGHGNLAEDLTEQANRDAAKFFRLCEEVPFFQEASPPNDLPSTMQSAMDNYNAAVDEYNNDDVISGLESNLNTLHRYTETAYIDVSNTPNFPERMLSVVEQRISELSNQITTVRSRPHADVDRLLADTKIVVERLNSIFSAVTKNRSFNENSALFNNAKDSMDEVIETIKSTGKIPTISGIEFDHFLTRHTAHYFDFGNIKNHNTLWNTVWGSDSSRQLSGQFTYVLENLTTSRNWLVANSPKTNQTTYSSGTAQISARSPVPGEIIVGQFFPEADTATNYAHSNPTMNAIKKII